MSKWKIENIERLADTYAGGTPSRSNPEYFKGEIPWISSGEVNQSKIYDTQEKITEDALKNSSAKWIPKNSILVAMYGATAGQVSTNLIDATSNQAVLALIPFKDKIESAFLYYSLSYNKHSILFLTQGTGQPNLSKGLIDSFAITLPKSLLEQTKIAKILSTADAVIEKTQAAIAKYKAIKQGMLQDLFTRGIDTVTNKLRPRYEDAPHLYKESKLGIIPKEWVEKSIEEIGDIVTGSTPATARIEYYGDEFLFVSPADIQNNFFIYKTGKKLTQSGFDVTRKLPENSICVVCIGSTIGKMALLAKEGCTNQQINSVICFDPELSFYFFYAMMLYNEPQFRRETGLQAVPIVNKSQFSEFLLPVAEKTEALKISERLKAIDNKLQTEQTYLQKIQLLKKGLMEDLLTGKKLVKVEEELTTQNEN
jgi:type I restriction enzyme S subunit